MRITSDATVVAVTAYAASPSHPHGASDALALRADLSAARRRALADSALTWL